jgi:hypothetical protein
MRRRYPYSTTAMQTVVLNPKKHSIDAKTPFSFIIHLLTQSCLVALVFLASLALVPRIGERQGTHILDLPATPLIKRISHTQEGITQRLCCADRGSEDNSRRVSRQRPRNTHATTLLHDLRRNRNHRVAGGQQVALEMSRRAPQTSAHAERLIRIIRHSSRFLIRTRRVRASPVLML